MRWKRIVSIGLCLVLALGLSVSAGICQQTKETDTNNAAPAQPQTKSPATQEAQPAEKAKIESDKSSTPKPWEERESKSGRFNPKEGC
ncbi:MAG: hypothetical protein ACLQVJ_16385 [Syntrophobacteraceae bacterium]